MRPVSTDTPHENESFFRPARRSSRQVRARSPPRAGREPRAERAGNGGGMGPSPGSSKISESGEPVGRSIQIGMVLRSSWPATTLSTPSSVKCWLAGSTFALITMEAAGSCSAGSRSTRALERSATQRQARASRRPVTASRRHQARNLAGIDPDQADRFRRLNHRRSSGPCDPRIIDNASTCRPNPRQFQRPASPRRCRACAHGERDLFPIRCRRGDRDLQPGGPGRQRRRMPGERIGRSSHEHAFRGPARAQLDLQLRRQCEQGAPVKLTVQTTGRSRDEKMAPDEARRLNRRLAKDQVGDGPRRQCLEDQPVDRARFLSRVEDSPSGTLRAFAHDVPRVEDHRRRSAGPDGVERPHGGNRPWALAGHTRMRQELYLGRRLEVAAQSHDHPPRPGRRLDAKSADGGPQHIYQLQARVKLDLERFGIARIELEQPVIRPVDGA